MSWRVKATAGMVLLYLLIVGYMFVNLSSAPARPETAPDVPHFYVSEPSTGAVDHNHTSEPPISTTSTTITPTTVPSTASPEQVKPENPAPVVPVAPEPAAQDSTPAVSVGSLHSCWVVDAKPVCEGAEYHGELGKDVELPPIVEVQAGLSRTCALTVDHEVWCWGWKMSYGDKYGRVEDAYEAVKVNLPGKVLKLAVGVGDECAVVANEGKEQIWCWGFSYSQEHGFALPYFAPPDKPVLMWEGRHVHELKVTYKYVQAHVGFSDGGCGWVHWGQPGEHFWDPIINRPERM